MRGPGPRWREKHATYFGIVDFASAVDWSITWLCQQATGIGSRSYVEGYRMKFVLVNSKTPQS
jgi:hypothetical protein